eukprot:g651.t1
MKYEKAEARRQAKKMRGQAKGMLVEVGPVTAAAAESASTEMPFTFTCPSTYEELTTLLKKWGATPKLAEILIHRIRVCNSAHHGGGLNKPKLLVFLGLLLRHMMEIVEEEDEAVQSKDSVQENCARIDAISRACWHIVREIPREAQQIFLSHVARIQSDVGSTQMFPHVGDLLILRLVSVFFSSSDFRHPVATPALLLMGQCLQQCAVRSVSDVAAGFFVVESMLSGTIDARRYTPEVLNFLNAFFASISLVKPNSVAEEETIRKARTKAKSLCPTFERMKGVISHEEEDIESINKALSTGSFGLLLREKASTHAELSASFFFCGIRLLKRVSKIACGLSSFPEMFSTTTKLLNSIAVSGWKEEFVSTNENIKRMSASADLVRTPLQLQKRQVRSIKQFVPAFDDVFQPGRSTVGDAPERRKREMDKLKRKVKRERKSAARELQRDAAFLSRVRAEESAKREKRMKEKYNEVKAFLENLQATHHQMVRKGQNIGGGSGGGGKKAKSRLTRTDGR